LVFRPKPPLYVRHGRSMRRSPPPLRALGGVKRGHHCYQNDDAADVSRVETEVSEA
jgi:hypothetical protein